MKKISTDIKGLYIIKNISFTDLRGEFTELWNNNKFEKENLKVNFFQDNISKSKKNVLRGLHFQNKPYGQTKYVRVIKGKVLDVVVDIRKKSKTLGQHFTIELTEKNNYGLWIPPGFAHGFLTLDKENIFIYKCAGQYKPKQEYTIQWNDPDLNVKWHINNPILSKKDNNGISFKEYMESNRING